ncbi:MAG: tetratricopeptide repeat protein [Spirochaetia bacterium]|jgi:tetratricopeptide (TPR) repeat protein|nr:tetratricopeptide repeat protein [Spirochaetia bacterium]
MKKSVFLTIILFAIIHTVYSENDVFTLNREADILVLDGDYYKAIEKYKTVLEINPDYINSVKGLADAYFYLGEFAEAYKQIKSARIFDKNNAELQGMEARVLLAMGRITEAEKIFKYINSKEPNNINAYFGFAEIALLTGRYSESALNYRDILSISPSNKKALLSLILLSDYQGRYDESEKYLSEVLRLYSGDYFALYIAARHYLQRGDFHQAERKIRDSIRIKQDYTESSLLFARLLLAKGDFNQIPEVLEPLYKKRTNNIVSYTLGKAYENTGEPDKALKYYADAFRINPDDEISRFALENLIRETKEYTDPLRNRYAEYHFDRGRGLEERNYNEKALSSYRRGLLVNPYSVRGRLQYANIFLKSGFRSKYLSELKTLPEKEKNKQYISDLIEIHESLNENTVSSRWNIDQFLIDRSGYDFNLFYIDSINMLHPGGEETIVDVFSDILNHTDAIKIKNNNFKIENYSQAFSASRNSDSPCDYFLILKIDESERIFEINAQLYSAYTGSVIKEYKINTTGNNRIWESLNKLADQLKTDSGLHGRIIRMDFDRGIINLGNYDNIKEEDSFLIVRKDRIIPDRTQIGKNYQAADLLGTFHITKTDEYISEGYIKNRDIFNLVNYGDIIVPETKETKKEEEINDKNSGYSLYNIIMGIK